MPVGGHICFTVPGPPIGKGRPRTRVFRGIAQVYTAPADKAYEARVRAAAQVAMNGRPPYEGRLTLAIRCFIPVPAGASRPKKLRLMSGEERWFGRYDVDNHAKSVLDGMNGVVFRDDRQVMGLSIRKVPVQAGGQVDVTVVSDDD